jgi:hypothetical protein
MCCRKLDKSRTHQIYQGSAILAALDPPEVPAESPTLDEAILTAANRPDPNQGIWR